MSSTVSAGSLGSEHIGQTVTVTWRNALITSTVTDELTSVTHKGSTVTLHFKRTQWRTSVLIGTAHDQGLTIASECKITIEENNA